MSNRRFIFNSAGLLVISLLLGCVTTPVDTDRDPSKTTIFRGKWFDYYNRALREYRQGDLAGAKKDFQVALAGGPEDSHRRRTYGVHFQNYYPHRGLGIIAFDEGDYITAIQQLQLSLQQAPTSRCKYYLNKARQRFIRAEGLDQQSPEIRFSDSLSGLLTNQLTIRVEGIAEDDTFVDSISVNGEPKFIELAEKQIQFQSDVRLRPGRNVIQVRATDLSGRWTENQIEILLDVEPPSFAINELRLDDTAGPKRLWLAANAFDPNGIRECRIGEEIIAAGKDTLSIRQWFTVEKSQAELDIYLSDTCGNEVCQKIDIHQELQSLKIGAAKPRRRILVASARTDISFDGSELLAYVGGPEISLGIADGHTAYQEEIFIGGRAFDLDGIQSVTIGGTSCSIAEGKDVSFGRTVELLLEEAPNPIEVVVVDRQGEKTIKTITVIRKIPAPKILDNRLNLVIYGGLMSEGALFDGFQKAVVGDYPQRFNFLNRDKEILDKILLEQAISALNKESAKKLRPRGQLNAGDLVVSSEIDPLAEGHEVRLDVSVVVEEQLRVPFLDVFIPKVDLESSGRIEYWMKGLYLRLLDAFPLVDGTITDTQKGIETNIPAEAVRLRPGSRLYVFPDKNSGDKTAELRVNSLVKGGNIKAKIVWLAENTDIQTGHYVITR